MCSPDAAQQAAAADGASKPYREALELANERAILAASVAEVIDEPHS
jgi:hypothetical protein